MPRPTKTHGRLAGKVALVTGAGGSAAGDSIGKAIAILMAAEGAKVAVVDIDEWRAAHTAGIIEGEGGAAITVQADIADDAACAAAVEAATQAWGRLDILVNSAAILGPPSRLETLDLEVWQRMMDVNLKACVLMARHALVPMLAQGGGVMVHVGSIAAVRSHGKDFAYGPAKGAMMSLSRDIAVTYGREGVRSNVILPGHVNTPMVADKGEAARKLRSAVGPMGVEGDAWDIAMAAVFLAGDESRFVSGVALPVDGGVTAVGPSKVVGWVE